MLSQIGSTRTPNGRSRVDKNVRLLGRHFNEIGSLIADRFKEHETSVTKRIDDYGAHIAVVEQTAAERAEDLKRYRDGYDFAVNRSLFLGICRRC